MLEFLEEAIDLERRALEPTPKCSNVVNACGSGVFTIMSPWNVIGRPEACRFRRLYKMSAISARRATTTAPIVPPIIAPNFLAFVEFPPDAPKADGLLGVCVEGADVGAVDELELLELLELSVGVELAAEGVLGTVGDKLSVLAPVVVVAVVISTVPRVTMLFGLSVYWISTSRLPVALNVVGTVKMKISVCGFVGEGRGGIVMVVRGPESEADNTTAKGEGVKEGPSLSPRPIVPVTT